jgi:hypothetical protein
MIAATAVMPVFGDWIREGGVKAHLAALDRILMIKK